MTIKKYRAPKCFEEKAEQYGYKYDLKAGTQRRGMDDEIDAFRHAYMQAHMTIEYGKDIAKVIGNIYEKWGDYTESQNAKQRNMDLWNNEIGRQIGEEIKNETSHLPDLTTQKMYEDMIAEKIYQRIQNGDMITEPQKDKRIYEEKGQPTGGASQVEPFTREQIGRMKSDEYARNEKATREQWGKIGIPSERDLPKESKKSASKSNDSNDTNGNWVTINGNHVLIKD